MSVILPHLNRFKKLGLAWEDAEESENQSIAGKVKSKLEDKKAFIGVFTRKYPLDKWFTKRLDPNNKNWDLRFLFKKPAVSAASSWIIQESGYAIAKNMKLILLVEEAVIDIGGLHADHELIPFPREHPEKCLPKLTEQLTKLLAEQEGIEEKAEAQPPPRIQENKEAEKETLRSPKSEEKPDTSERQYYAELWVEIVEKRNPEGGKEIYEEWLRSLTTEEEKVRVQVMYQDCRRDAGATDALREIEQLAKGHPQHPLPFLALGWSLRELGEDARAADAYISAAERQSSWKLKAHHLGSAADCLIKDSRAESADELLTKALNEHGLDGNAAFELYVGLARVAEARKDDTKQFACLEKALSLFPSNHKLRFQLAYKYGQSNRQKLALYHYRILATESPDGITLNNLGVAFSKLGLDAKSVAAFKSSVKQDETLAMANLAHKFIDQGFIEEAAVLVNKALTNKDYHTRVASARARIVPLQEEEEEKEKNALQSIDAERKFHISFAEALFQKPESVSSIAGRWKTPHGEVEFGASGNQITGKNEWPETDSALDIFGLGSFGKSPSTTIRSLEVDFVLCGAAGRGSISLGTRTEGQQFHEATKKDYKIELVIETSSSIRVLEIDEKDNRSVVTFDWLVRKRAEG